MSSEEKRGHVFVLECALTTNDERNSLSGQPLYCVMLDENDK